MASSSNIVDAAAIDQEIILSHHGFLPWFESYGWIRNKERKLEQPESNPFQERCSQAIAWCRANGRPIRLIKLKGRQQGCSTISVAEAYHLARSTPINGVIIGGEYSQVENLWEILRLYHTKDRFNWPNDGLVQARSATWTNGSRFGWETARDAEAGRSGTIQCVIATEAARWKEAGASNATAVITGILNCVPDLPDTMVILESTALGDYGMFYDYYQDAAELDDVIAGRVGSNWNGYIRVFSPWFEHAEAEDRLTPTEARTVASSYTDDERTMVAAYALRPGHISWYRRTMRTKCKRNPQIMKREYPGTAAEAFHAASNRRFNGAGLAILEAQARQSKFDTGLFQPLVARSGELLDYAFIPCPPAAATVCISDPPTVGHSYILPVDIATGADQTGGDDPDHHAPLVIRAGYWDKDRGWKPPKVVAWAPDPCRWPIDILAGVTHALSVYYGNCLIVPEANDDRGLILLLKQLNANIFQRYSDDDQPAGAKAPKPTGKYGFKTTGGQSENTRNWIIENLDSIIREWDTDGNGIEIPDLLTIQELKSFVVDRKTGRAEAADGRHDDRVLSLAIGMALIRLATVFQAKSGPSVIPHDLRDLVDDHHAGRGQFS